MNNYIIFLIGLGQVFLVSMNIYFVSHTNWIGIIGTGFGVSYVWAINVGCIANSNQKTKIIYGLGAMCGCILGTIISKYLTS